MKLFKRPSTPKFISLVLVGMLSAVPLTSKADETDGKLLYETYCISCHTTQVHWRQNRLATDWITLKGQIDRWQTTIGQSWNRQQIDDVAKYLNGQFYKFNPAIESRTEIKPGLPLLADRVVRRP